MTLPMGMFRGITPFPAKTAAQIHDEEYSKIGNPPRRHKNRSEEWKGGSGNEFPEKTAQDMAEGLKSRNWPSGKKTGRMGWRTHCWHWWMFKEDASPWCPHGKYPDERRARTSFDTIAKKIRNGVNGSYGVRLISPDGTVVEEILAEKRPDIQNLWVKMGLDENGKRKKEKGKRKMRKLDEVEHLMTHGDIPSERERRHMFRIIREAEAHTHHVLNSDELVRAVDAAREDGFLPSFEELEPEPPPKKKKKKWVTRMVEVEV